MKFGVITFPGSNCDHDLLYCLEKITGEKPVSLWHKDHDLQGCDMVFCPGGFSYGDYLRSGAIARFSPIMKEVIDFAGKGGYVMGICNGFQILTEAGLLDGALLHNNSRNFICKNVHLRTETSNSLVTRAIEKGTVLQIPIAHGEGKFFCDSDTLKQINDEDRVLFRYCTENGEITDAANPNGALDNIAGITNKGRNVFGMMPHPERAWADYLSNTDGRSLFESILEKVTA
jgi:phosphoribosylformylglycinamidine synthase I